MFGLWRIKFFLAKALFDLRYFADFIEFHPFRLMRRHAAETTLAYIIEKMGSAIPFPTTKELMKFALRNSLPDGNILEFGVFRGGSIRFIAKVLRHRMIYGFDSFRGLPEEWPSWVRYSDGFDLRGKIPRVPKNVILYEGYFKDRIPKFLEESGDRIAFMHIDCDLYSSTKDIFDLLYERIVPGTIIGFDEYFNYPNWQNGEFRAFQEFVKKHSVKYEYIGYAATQVSVRILNSGV